VVRSNEEARKHLTESNGTPAMDLGHMNVVLKYYYFYVVFEDAFEFLVKTITLDKGYCDGLESGLR